MKVYLLDKNPAIVDAWKKWFGTEEAVVKPEILPNADKVMILSGEKTIKKEQKHRGVSALRFFNI